jgi:glycosyltransferase involved in cell wall biosynthesis
MKILLAHNFYRSLGGEDHYVRMLESALPKRGVEVATLFAATEPQLRLSGRLSAAWRQVAPAVGLARLRAVLERERVDVAHLHNLYPYVGARSAETLQRRGVAVVMTCHNFRLVAPCGVLARAGTVCELCGRGNYLHMIRHNCRQSAPQSVVYALALGRDRAQGHPHRHVDRFLTPSRFLADKLIQYGVPAMRVQVLPHGIVVPPNLPETTNSRGAIYVGRLSSEKGVHVLLAAMARCPEVPLTIVGEGPQRPALERAASRLPAGQVTFRGQLSRLEVLEGLTQSAFAVVPSICYEAFSLAAVETMAMGRALIVSRIGALPELVGEEEAGLIVPTGDVAALADAMKRLATDPTLARRLGAEGQRRALRKWSLNEHLNGLISVYEAVRNRGRLDPSAGVTTGARS